LIAVSIVKPTRLDESPIGDRLGQYSIRINDRWRICFEWKDGHAYWVEILDYH
jgi:Plasmid maintenance system killer protein